MRWNMDHTGGRTLFGFVLLTFALCVSSPASARDHVPTSQDCAALTTARLAIRDHAAGEHGHADQGAVLAKAIDPTLTSATWKPATGSVPEYCPVEGFIATRDPPQAVNRVRFPSMRPTHGNR